MVTVKLNKLDSVLVEVEGETFHISYGKSKVLVKASEADDKGRKGVIYEHIFMGGHRKAEQEGHSKQVDDPQLPALTEQSGDAAGLPETPSQQ